MVPTLESLFRESVDSLLISYTFESKELRFQLFHSGVGGLITFHVATDTVLGRSVSSDPSRATCRLEVIDLASRLAIRDGRYIPSTTPSALLGDARDRLGLAHGRRASEAKALLVVRGRETPRLACLVATPSDIHWTIE